MDLKSNVKDKSNLEARLACMMFSKKNMAIIPVGINDKVGIVPLLKLFKEKHIKRLKITCLIFNTEEAKSG